VFIIPYKLETVFTRVPVVNMVVIAITSVFSFMVFFGGVPEPTIEAMILREWDIGQMLGCTLLHGGFFHLAGNMVFLWVFGNAVCGTVGNAWYPLLYLLFGIVASATHLLFSGAPAIGASGVVNGIIGFSLVLFPVNRLTTWYGFSMPMMGIFWKSGTFTVRTFWMILAWFAFDLLGVLVVAGGVAYWAHIGGLTIGVVTGLLLILLNIIETYEPTILDAFTGKKFEREAYTLDELQQMPAALPTGAQAFVADRPATSAHTPAPPRETKPVFLITGITSAAQETRCFFVYEGGTIGNVAVHAHPPIVAEITPNKALRKGTSGILRLKNGAASDLLSLKLTLSYAIAGKAEHKELTYKAQEKKLIVNEL
jgi:membrane associated rhomboid family serine protease